MGRKSLLILGLLLIGVALTSAAPGSGASRPSTLRDVDCSDFDSQAAAQHYLDSHGPGDPDGLDADGDGVACESNPCPCAQPGSGSGGGGGTTGGGGAASGKRSTAEVVSVTDGDTIKVSLHGAEKDVRIIGIDTPEVYGGVECGGPKASAAMKRLLQAGDKVSLITDPSQDSVDRYGRLLRYVEHSGTDVGRKQVLHGRAHVYVYGGVPFVRTKSYRRAQDEAKRSGRGNWGHCGGRFRRAT